uniref:Peptidase A1 domain-containing protein n=1 Tax=Pundamilia nyererei TaxID=303518 RepID=A0A3B4F6B2_9CICH
HKCLVVVLVWVVLAEGTVKASTPVIEDELPYQDMCINNYADTSTLAHPPKSFEVLFDTSSANLWVDLVCCNTQACNTRRKLDPQQSSTATAKYLYFYLPYETRSLGGVFRCDTVNVGGIVITNQIFLTAFSDYPNLSISAGRRTPLMDNMITQNLLSSKIFCFFLSSSGLICGSDENISIICWTPATSETYWQIGVQGFLINTGWCSQSCQAMLTAPNQPNKISMDRVQQFANPALFYYNRISCLHLQQNQNGCQYCSVSMTPTYQPSPNGQPLRTFGDVLLRDRVGFAIVV